MLVLACLQRWLLLTSPLPVHAHQTSRERGGYLFFFTGFNLGTLVSHDPSRRCRKGHWTSSRLCLLEDGQFQLLSFTAVKTLLRMQPRCHGSPSFVQRPLRDSSWHPHWALCCPPAPAASPVREPLWLSSPSWHLTATEWETLSENCPAEPLLNSWLTKSQDKKIIVYTTKFWG